MPATKFYDYRFFSQNINSWGSVLSQLEEIYRRYYVSIKSSWHSFEISLRRKFNVAHILLDGWRMELTSNIKLVRIFLPHTELYVTLIRHQCSAGSPLRERFLKR